MERARCRPLEFCVLGGVVALPAGDVRESFVDAEDVTDAAVAALTERGHSGQFYELTGARLLTLAEAVEEIAKATGLEIAYVPNSRKTFVSSLAE